MQDDTENIRRSMVARINAEAGPREQLQAKYGQVWDTQELQRDYNVHSFFAPIIIVTRKSDGVKGTLEFQHSPRFYFNFVPGNA